MPLVSRARRSTGSMPGAWAPSTSTSTPRAASSRASSATGRTTAVGLVTWLSSARRGRGGGEPAPPALSRPAHREGQRGHDEPRPVPFGHVAGRVQAGVVLVVGAEDFVTGGDAQRAQDGSDAAGRVVHEGEGVGGGAGGGGGPSAGRV